MATITAARSVGRDWNGERTFHVAMAVAILGAVLLGFSRSYYFHALFPERPGPPEAFFGFHGAVFTAWYVLLVVQTLLVANRRPDLHRALGGAGVGLVVLMLAVGLYGAALAGGRPGGFVGVPVPGPQFMIVPVVDMLLLAAFVALAVAKRHDAPAHKRWMLLASIAMLPAAVARWPVVEDLANPLVYFAVADLFLVPILVRDVSTRGTPHPATLWGGLAIVISQPLRLALSGTEGWQAVARSMIGLVA